MAWKPAGFRPPLPGELMKNLYLFATTFLLFLIGCTTPAQPTPSPTAIPSVGVGFRFSTYGAPGGLGPDYWKTVGLNLAGKFPNAHPETIWIVGNIYGEGVYLNFPCASDDPYIKCGFVDMNEQALNLFDENGFKVWLQVEPGNASVDALIPLVLNHYKDHPSVVGFGLDVEWYQSTDGPLGVPIGDEEAARWAKAVQAVNPNYRLFLKHWEIDWMPPLYREGILFVNDEQGFADLTAMVDSFAAWGQHFAPAGVGYQFGYHTDQLWWKDLADPAGTIGQAILSRIPNTTSLYWVDFTIDRLFPPDY